MVKDNLKPEYPISTQIRFILPTLQRLIEEFRARNYPVVFACDSYLPNDFIFRGKIKPHSIEGTEGAQVIDELSPQPTDLVLPKRRFSAFFKTGLNDTLRGWGVDTLAVAGVTTHVCVLMTAMDALCHDFAVFVLKDCCASYRTEIHRSTIKIYERSSLEPLLRFSTLEEFLSLLEGHPIEA
ncbi:MAG: isochorismatase family protein [Proteobacteria bacterium]|nr:isochorismatase family protein [Pseudomonadota bacterium]